MYTERMSRSPRVRMEGRRQPKLGTAVVRNSSEKEHDDVFLRPEHLAMAGCGGPSRLKMNSLALGLDGRPASPKEHPLSGQRKTSDMNLPNLK
jgi:hypothetical protein